MSELSVADIHRIIALEACDGIAHNLKNLTPAELKAAPPHYCHYMVGKLDSFLEMAHGQLDSILMESEKKDAIRKCYDALQHENISAGVVEFAERGGFAHWYEHYITLYRHGVSIGGKL